MGKIKAKNISVIEVKKFESCSCNIIWLKELIQETEDREKFSLKKLRKKVAEPENYFYLAKNDKNKEVLGYAHFVHDENNHKLISKTIYAKDNEKIVLEKLMNQMYVLRNDKNKRIYELDIEDSKGILSKFTIPSTGWGKVKEGKYKKKFRRRPNILLYLWEFIKAEFVNCFNNDLVFRELKKKYQDMDEVDTSVLEESLKNTRNYTIILIPFFFWLFFRKELPSFEVFATITTVALVYIFGGSLLISLNKKAWCRWFLTALLYGFLFILVIPVAHKIIEYFSYSNKVTKFDNWLLWYMLIIVIILLLSKLYITVLESIKRMGK